MRRLVIYIHGKGGNAKEAEHYKSLFTKNDVIVRILKKKWGKFLRDSASVFLNLLKKSLALQREPLTGMLHSVR